MSENPRTWPEKAGLVWDQNPLAQELRMLRDENSWVLVTERLPEPHKTVLVVQNGCVSARFYSTEKAAFVNPFGVTMDFVTHWRHLPAPPKVE